MLRLEAGGEEIRTCRSRQMNSAAVSDCSAFIGDCLDIDAGDGQLGHLERQPQRRRPAQPRGVRRLPPPRNGLTIQSRLDSGALDQEAFARVIE